MSRSGGNPRRAERVEQRARAAAAANIAVRAAAYSGVRLRGGVPATSSDLPRQRDSGGRQAGLQILVHR